MKILKKKNECYLHGYGAMFSMENLDNQTFISKNQNLGHESDANVKLALISISLAAKIF